MSACSSILCDLCLNPGRCCSDFPLNIGYIGQTKLEALVRVATVSHGFSHEGLSIAFDIKAPRSAKRVQLGLPFMPTYLGDDGYWRYSCTLLGEDGRCTDYENRPSLCVQYEAGGSICGDMKAPPD